MCASTYADRHWILPNTFGAYSHFNGEEREVTYCHKAGSLGKAHNCSILSILTLKKKSHHFLTVIFFLLWMISWTFFLYFSRPNSNINSYHLLNFYSVLITLPQGLHLTTPRQVLLSHPHEDCNWGKTKSELLPRSHSLYVQQKPEATFSQLPSSIFLQIWELLLV